MQKTIQSVQNSYIKELFQLKEKSRVRKKTGLFLIEGFREISLAIKGSFEITTVLFDNTIISIDQLSELNLAKNTEIIEISKEVYKKIAYRATTEGVIAVAKYKSSKLEKLKFKTKNPLILVAEAPEKPGNIGALLRTADAAGIDAVLIANPKTDIFNPNIVRSSVGCVFTTQIAEGSSSEIIAFLKRQQVSIYSAALTASVSYETIDYKKPSAIIVGTESTGLSNEWLENSTQNIKIPMNGIIDSLNVSVSAAIIIYEAIRQRLQS
jgi:TrmH family RNA methyltransferase